MSSIRLKVLVVQILSFCLKGTFNYEKVLKIAGENADGIADIKGAVAALHFMLTNAAKYDVDEKSFVQEVLQLGLPKENTEAIARQYREAREYLRARLAEESFRVSKLYSVDWRVDQVIATSAEARGQPQQGAGEGAADSTTAIDGSDSSIAKGTTPVLTSARPTVHLNLQIDAKPELSVFEDVESKSVIPGQLKDISFEIAPNKLNVLIHELSQAQKLLQSMDI